MNYTNELRIDNIDGLSEVASRLIGAYPDSRVFSIYGQMGAGKTTLVKAVCKHLGSSDKATSPTFSIVNEYDIPNGSKIFHFDFYRLKSLDEVFNIGYEEYFYSGNYCFVEWPGIIEPLLPPNTVGVHISEESGVRLFRF